MNAAQLISLASDLLQTPMFYKPSAFPVILIAAVSSIFRMHSRTTFVSDIQAFLFLLGGLQLLPPTH